MRKGCFIFLFILYCHSFSRGQNNTPASYVAGYKAKIASLRTALSLASSDTARINIEIGIADVYLGYLPDSAMQLLDRLETRSTQSGHITGLVRIYQLKGTYWEVVHKNYAEALRFYNRAFDLALQQNNTPEIHNLGVNLLNLYFYLGEFINAAKIASSGLLIAEKQHDQKKMAHYNNIMGFIHLRQGNASGAETYYMRCFELSQKANDSIAVADAQNALGEVFILKQDYPRALQYLQQSLDLYRNFYNANRLPKKDQLPYALFKLGYAYGEKKEYAKALPYIDEALRLSHFISCNRYDLAEYYIYAGNLYGITGNFRKAKQLLWTGLGISKNIHHKETMRDAYMYLHQLHARQRRFDSAYIYYSSYERIKDSIINDKTRKEISQIDANHKLEKKDAEIALLNQQKELQASQANRQLLLRNLVIVFIVLVTVSALFLVNQRHHRRKNRLQEEINHKQKELFSMAATVQDHERKRIAQDLHDGMGTLLSAAKLKLSAFNNPHRSVEITDTVGLLDDAISELRNISHNLMPAALSKLGVVAALQNVFLRISESRGLQIDLITHGLDTRLDEEKEMFVYRIILELVNNVVKHSKATKATVQLVKFSSALNIMVEDNGVGFEPEWSRKGMGLSNIRSRVDFLKGIIDIDSAKGTGTTVMIDIPC